MTAPEVVVVRAMAQVSETFIRIATALRRQDDVVGVTQPFFLRAEHRVSEGLDAEHFIVGSGDGFRAEWYAEAAFADGRVLTFTLEAAWHDEEWVIDAGAGSHRQGDEHSVLELPRRYAIDAAELLRELAGQCVMLEEGCAEALTRFRITD